MSGPVRLVPRHLAAQRPAVAGEVLGGRVELRRLPAGQWCVVLVNDRGERRYDQTADLLTQAEAEELGNEMAEFLRWPVVWVW